MADGRVEEEIKRLHSLVSDSEATFELMNQLILHISSRFQCIKSGISFISHCLFQGRDALTLMSILHKGILLYQSAPSSSQFNGMDDEIINEKSSRKKDFSLENDEEEWGRMEETEEEREERIELSLDQLSLIAKHLSDSILYVPNAMEEEEEEGLLNRKKEMGGIITSLDLVGTLVTVAKSLEEQYNRKSFTSEEILLHFLRPRGRRKIKMDFIPAFFSCVSELNLDSSELRMLRELMESYIKERGREISMVLKQFFPLFRAERKDKEKKKWIELLILLLQKIPENEMGTVQFVVEMGLQHSRSVVIWLLEFVQDKTERMTVVQDFNPTWLLILILIASLSEERRGAFKIIVEVFNKLFNITNGKERKDTQKSLIHYLHSLIRTNGMEMRAQILTELGLFLFLLDDEYLIALKGAYPKKVKAIGGQILSQIFLTFPMARSEILSNILGEISDGYSLAIKLQYCSLLHQICEGGILLLSEFLPKIQDWMVFIQYFPLQVGVKIVNSLLPLIQLSPSFLDFLFIHFRKLLIARNGNTRTLAIRSLFLLLCSPYLNSSSRKAPSFQMEILSILKPIFNAPLEIREHLYSSLFQFLRKCEESKILEDESVDFLLEMIMGRFERFISLDSSLNIRPEDSYHLNMVSSSSPFGEPFRITKAFDDLPIIREEKDENEIQSKKREDVARLFSLLIQVSSHIMNLEDGKQNRFHRFRQLQSVILSVTIQFGHPQSFALLINPNESEYIPCDKGKSQNEKNNFIKAKISLLLQNQSGKDIISLPPLPDCPSEKILESQRVELMIPVYLLLTESFSSNILFKDLFKTCSISGSFKACLYYFNRFSLIHLRHPKLNWTDSFLSIDTILKILDCFSETFHLNHCKEKDLEPSNDSIPPFVSLQMAISCLHITEKFLSTSNENNPFTPNQLEDDQSFQLCKILLNLLHICLNEKGKLKSKVMKNSNKDMKPKSTNFEMMLQLSILNCIYLLFSKYIFLPSAEGERIMIYEINFEGIESLANIFKRIVRITKRQEHEQIYEFFEDFDEESIDCSHIAIFFAKNLEKEVEQSIGIQSAQNYVKIIELLSKGIAPKRWRRTVQLSDSLGEVIQTFENILLEYRIPNDTIVTLILKYILEYAPRKHAMITALETLEFCVLKKKGSSKERLQVCETENCRDASIMLIISLFTPWISDLLISFREYYRLIECIIQLVSTEMKQTHRLKVFAIVLKLASWSTRLLISGSEGSEKKKIDKELSPIFSEERYISVLMHLKRLFGLVIYRIETGQETSGKMMKIPLISSKIEKFEVKLQHLLTLNKKHSEYDSLKKQFKEVDKEFKIDKQTSKRRRSKANDTELNSEDEHEDEDEENEGGESEKDEEIKRKRRRGRPKRRSTNSFVDANLYELDDDDDLEELEDFIVCKKGRSY